MQKYSIVEFIKENSVEIILSSWISNNNKTALWPKNITPSILKKYLKNSTAPSDDWTSVHIRVLGHTDSLSDATKKAYKAQETSHLSSSNSDLEEPKAKRQKKLPARYQESTDSSDENVESEKHMNSEKQITRPVIPLFPEFQNSKITEHKKTLQNQNTKNNSTTCIETTNSTPKVQEEQSKNIQQAKEGVLTKIFKVMEEIRFEVIASKKEQQETNQKLDTLLIQNNNVNTINKFSRIFPISSMESFDEIDQCLSNSEEDFLSLVKYLNLASGETITQLVPSIMKLLMKKAVSIKFSGSGKQKKRDFSATTVAAAVFEIVTKKFENASKTEILKKISKFLAESGDREGGRKERKINEKTKENE